MSKKNKVRKVSSLGTEPTVAMDSVLASAALKKANTEFNPDYTPVIKDLRRIGMLAASFFLILIVLSFFLR